MSLIKEVCKQCVEGVGQVWGARTEFPECWADDERNWHNSIGQVACPGGYSGKYSYREHGDIGLVRKAPPIWCPLKSRHKEKTDE